MNGAHALVAFCVLALNVSCSGKSGGCPGTLGYTFVVGDVVGSKGGKRTLTLREAQHEYVFLEAG